MSIVGMSRSEVLKLYKALLRESRKIPSYNFRTYAIRRTRDAFKENKKLTDSNEITKCIESGKSNLALVQRQATISNLYQTHKLIIEQM